MTKITFLGTACMQPTKEKNHPCILITYKGENILMDCGEGSQRQIKLAGIKPASITRILITHWHGDHTLGLSGLMQTMAAGEYSKKLYIYGPTGTKEKLGKLIEVYGTKDFIEHEVKEIEDDGIFYQNEDFQLESYKLRHGIPTLGFCFVEKDKLRINMAYARKIGLPDGPLMGKLQSGQDIMFKGDKIKVENATTIVPGKKLGYISDTLPCPGTMKVAENADLLISESSFSSKLKDKAEKYMHMTSADAALTASSAGAKKLILTHISQRYKTTEEVLNDAKTYFDNVSCAEDFMKIIL